MRFQWINAKSPFLFLCRRAYWFHLSPHNFIVKESYVFIYKTGNSIAYRKGDNRKQKEIYQNLDNRKKKSGRKEGKEAHRPSFNNLHRHYVYISIYKREIRDQIYLTSFAVHIQNFGNPK